MDIAFRTRRFYPDEQRLLKKLKTQKEKEGREKVRFHYFIIAGLLGTGFMYLASLTTNKFLVFALGTIAVLSFGFVLLAPYELYKMYRSNKRFMTKLNNLIEKGTVETCRINAIRIACAKEYEDEGDLYIIEYDSNKVLFLWDYDYNLRKKFPCLEFELYDDDFFRLFGRQVYPLSERIKPILIDKKAKWNYLSRFGSPGNLETETVDFDKLVQDYNKCA
jgi:hypothetical protein